MIALITAGSALAGVAISTAAQFILSNQAHKHAVEDDKHARIGHYFAKFYSTAFVYLTYAQERRIMQMPMYAEPTQNQIERSNLIRDELHKAKTEAQEAIAMLVLEGGNDEIVDAYLEFHTAFTQYITSKDDDNTELNASFQRILKMMRHKYSNLEKVPSHTNTPE